MGNDNNKNQYNQSFTQTCHPGLIDSKYHNDAQTLNKIIHAQASVLDWYNDITRLQNKTHLFLPLKIVDLADPLLTGCCAQQHQLNPHAELKQICYPAFFYTLHKQILSRKGKSFFREWQLWKLIIFMCKGCLQWQQVYPNQSLGVICPQNVVINSKGIVKLVCKISFYQQVYTQSHQYYIPPEAYLNAIIKYTFNPNCQPLAVQSASVYTMGKTMLQTITLVSGSAELNLEQRLNILKNTLYSWQLKTMVQRMVRENQNERPRLRQLLKYAKINRSKFQ